MKPKTIYTKMDVIVTAGCIVFLLANIGAVGPGGQRHAKEMLCLSQLHKWGTFFQSYLNDNDGYFMRGWSDTGTVKSDYWMEALRQYYGGSDKLRCCPEAVVPGSEAGGSQFGGNGVFTAWGVFDESWSPVVPGDYGSYGWNGYLANPRPGEGIWGIEDVNWRTANVNGAGNIPLLGDHQFVDCWPGEHDEPPDYDGQPWNSTSQMGRCCINRHSGYVNWAFLDFSARRVGLKEMWTLKWHREYDTCSVWTVCGGITPGDWPIWMQDFEDY